jgi:hypothetical protein
MGTENQIGLDAEAEDFLFPHPGCFLEELQEIFQRRRHIKRYAPRLTESPLY